MRLWLWSGSGTLAAEVCVLHTRDMSTTPGADTDHDCDMYGP